MFRVVITDQEEALYMPDASPDAQPHVLHYTGAWSSPKQQPRPSTVPKHWTEYYMHRTSIRTKSLIYSLLSSFSKFNSIITTLQYTESRKPMQAHEWQTEGFRKGRPRQTWRYTVTSDPRELELSWEDVAAAAKDMQWRHLRVAQSIMDAERIKDQGEGKYGKRLIKDKTTVPSYHSSNHDNNNNNEKKNEQQIIAMFVHCTMNRDSALNSRQTSYEVNQLGL